MKRQPKPSTTRLATRVHLKTIRVTDREGCLHEIKAHEFQVKVEGSGVGLLLVRGGQIAAYFRDPIGVVEKEVPPPPMPTRAEISRYAAAHGVPSANDPCFLAFIEQLLIAGRQ